MTRTRMGRRIAVGLGVFYLACAAFNAVIALPAADAVYAAFREMAWLAPYTWLIDTVVAPHAVAFTVALVAFELVAGVLMLQRGRAGRVGHTLGAVFVLALIGSLAWPYWTANVVLAGLHTVAWRSTSDAGEPAAGRAPDLVATRR